MSKGTFVLAVDQGTSSTKTLVFDAQGNAVARGVAPLQTIYSGNGFVEQDAEGIYQNVLQSVQHCLADFTANGFKVDDIGAVGISNQRETFVVWNAAGKPLHNAIVWQCKRSVGVCNRWQLDGWEPVIRQKTGLVIDPYFSGSKMVWLADNHPGVQDALVAGEAFFGTIDTWLLYRLTNGAQYRTDYTNASRTLFFNLHQLDWDDELLDLFGLSNLKLPAAQPSSSWFGETDCNGLFNHAIPVTAMIGDSHAAAFGEGCFVPGSAKATLGTGCSVLMNVGTSLRFSDSGMVSTICWSTEERVDYALEGVIVSCGATLEWLKNDLQLFANSKDTEAMATAVDNNGGVYLVPAFSGLGAPHWDMARRGSITGLSFASNKNHIVRAALESIPYQVKDVINAMAADSGIDLQALQVDGGITSNRFVLQLLADLLVRDVVNIGIADVSALGAAYLAGLKSGLYNSIEQLATFYNNKTVVSPSAERQKAEGWYKGWKAAIAEGQKQSQPANVL